MRLLDLTAAYAQHFLKNNDRLAYERSHPGLFSHYYRFWADTAKPPATLSASDLARRRDLILSALPVLEERFAGLGFDTTEIDLALFVGQSTSNGHALVKSGRALAWVTVETYTSPLLAEVFVAHELAHALHYLLSPGFRFSNVEQKEDPVRQLLTEGVATWLTQVANCSDDATALWADYLKPEPLRRWMRDCRENITRLAQQLVRDCHEERDTALFLASKPDDISHFRGGYYLGLTVIKSIVAGRNLSPIQLLCLQRDKLETQALRLLRNPSDLMPV